MTDITNECLDASVEAARDSQASVLGKVEDVFEGAAQASKQLYKSLSDGSPTGITCDFGKPLIFDGARPEQDISKIAGLGKPVQDSADDVPRAASQKSADAEEPAKVDGEVAQNELVFGRPGIEWPGGQTWYRQGKDTPSPAPERSTEPSNGSAEQPTPRIFRTPVETPEETWHRQGKDTPSSPAPGSTDAPADKSEAAEGEVAEVTESKDHKTRVSTLKNGDVFTEYTDGPVKSIYENKQDGTVSTEFRNGDKQYEYKDGTILTDYKNGDRRTESPDGTSICQFKDGETVTFFPNGVIRTQFKNGDIKDEQKDGSTLTRKKDGTIIEENKDHSLRIVFHTDGSREEIQQDGTITTVRADGTFETKDYQGKVIRSGQQAPQRKQ